MDNVPLHGEILAVPERVIVAPTVGVFRPLEADGTEIVIAAGQAIGVVEGPNASTPVRSPFPGALMGMLVRTGERVREGQPIAWLRLT